MNSIKALLCTNLCWILFLSANGFADGPQPDSTIKELNKVVVTATKQSRSTSDIPVSATIIGKEDIALSEAKNIDDLLQHAAGVQVKRPVGMGEGVPSDIIMRGIPGALAATRTLILVDGIPTNLSGTPFLILNEIPLEAIKRIEIIRGPFSSIYGANAFGGVINIITDFGDGRPSVLATAETSYPFTSIKNYGKENRQTGIDFWGENARIAFWNFSAVAGAGDEKGDILIAGGYRTIGNYFLQDSALGRRGNTTRHKDIGNHDYSDFRALLKSGWRISNRLKNTVHLRYFISDLGFGTTETNPNAHVDVRGNKLLVGDFIDFTPRNDLYLKIGVFFRMVDGDYADKADSITFSDQKMTVHSKVPTMWDARSRDVQGEGSVIYTPSSVHTIIAGFDVLYNLIHFGALKYRSTGEVRIGEADVDKKFWNSGFYAQDDIRFNGVNVIPAFRFDYHSKFGPMISPKLGISSRIAERLTLRTSAGSAFRAPSTTELYGNVVMGSVKIVGNPELEPERVFSVDGGIEADLFGNWTFQSDLFYNRMRNLITLRPKGTLITEITHDNLDKAYSWGIENEVTTTLWNTLNLSLNYTFTQSENLKYRKPLDYIPAHKAHGELRFTKRTGMGTVVLSVKENFVNKREYIDWGSSTITQIFTGDTTNGGDGFEEHFRPNFVELKSYWKTDIAVSFTMQNDHCISLNVQNMFDATIEESGGTYAPGRFASIKYSAPFRF